MPPPGNRGHRSVTTRSPGGACGGRYTDASRLAAERVARVRPPRRLHACPRSQHSSTTTEHRSGYWDEYYAARATTRRPLPSQFATFVAGELDRPHHVIELGCGNGRDAIFFASYGHDVIGGRRLGGRRRGIGVARRGAGREGHLHPLRHRRPDPRRPAPESDGPKAVYARFFVHAITDGEEQVLLDLAAEGDQPRRLLAVEYRTVRDQVGAKETETHFRRFVLPATFQARALERGFEVTYAVEGFGFAKYRHDDAYVARTLFRRA